MVQIQKRSHAVYCKFFAEGKALICVFGHILTVPEKKSF